MSFKIKIIAKYGLELVTEENQMIHELKVGDHIELIKMGEDPRPIEPGTKGVVTQVTKFQRGAQVKVKWENGRGLMLSLPEDKIKILKGA